MRQSTTDHAFASTSLNLQGNKLICLESYQFIYYFLICCYEKIYKFLLYALIFLFEVNKLKTFKKLSGLLIIVVRLINLDCSIFPTLHVYKVLSDFTKAF